MYCKYCGKEIFTSSICCSSCQTKLNKIGFLLQSFGADEQTVENAYRYVEKELSSNEV